MTDPDKTELWATPKAADELIGPGGGVVIWVRSDDLIPEAEARIDLGTIEHACRHVAALDIGLDMMRKLFAKRFNCTEEVLQGVIDSERRQIGQGYEPCGKIT